MENKIKNSDLYGKWTIIESEFHPYKTNIKDKDSLKMYNEAVSKLKESLKESYGKNISFNNDSTFISEDQPNNVSYWIKDKDIDRVYFSINRNPFITSYTFDKLTLSKNELEIYDYVNKNTGYFLMKLIKSK